MNVAKNVVSELVKGAVGVFDELQFSSEEKAVAAAKLEELAVRKTAELEKSWRAEVRAQAEIISAELKQEDKFTKRARPTLIYAGLVFIAWNYCLIPTLAHFGGSTPPPTLALPAEFWYAWGGACGLYIFYRSKDKRGLKA